MAGISAILIAAGESTRMGCPKPLLSWHGLTLLEYQIQSLTAGGTAEVVVVLGSQADLVSPYAKGPLVRCVVNPDYRLGKTTSIRAGIRAVDPGNDGVLLLAVDQPRTPDIISTVIQAHVGNNALITSPRFQGRGAHPLIFSASLIGELERISEDRQGVREVLQAHRHEVTEVGIADPLVRLDLNTPEAFEEAKKLYGA